MSIVNESHKVDSLENHEIIWRFYAIIILQTIIFDGPGLSHIKDN